MHFWDRHKTITGYYESLTSTICDKYDLTQMEYDILMFLHGNPEFNTAADIVKIRKSTKSHVSTSLKSLENKGLIEKKQSESNKKHIEIFVTESAKSIIYEGIDTQKRFAHDVLKGFSDEEIADALAQNIQTVTLGPRILRCETAPIAAVAAIMYELGDCLDSPLEERK